MKKNPKRSVTDVQVELQSEGIYLSWSTVRRRLISDGFHGYTARCKPLISEKNRRMRLEFARKYLNKPVSFWKSILWTDETKINLYQSDVKCKVWRRANTADDPRNTNSSVKHGGGNVIWPGLPLLPLVLVP